MSIVNLISFDQIFQHVSSTPGTPEHDAEISTIIAECESQTGVNPTAIYCQQTGAQIGTLSLGEFSVMLSMIPQMDRESLYDDLFARTIMSMRPSPSMNYLRQDTIESLRTLHPDRLCAFLLGRYFRPRAKHYNRLKRSYDSIMDDGRRQIDIFRFAAQLDFKSNESHQWFLHFLLEIDARFDLSLMDQLAEIPNLTEDLNPVNVEAYVESMRGVVLALQARKDKLEKEAALHNSWLANGGSKLVRKAYGKSFMAMNPETSKSEAAQDRNRRKREIRNLLAGLLDGYDFDSAPKAEATILPKPKVAGLKFGKLKFKIISNASE